VVSVDIGEYLAGLSRQGKFCGAAFVRQGAETLLDAAYGDADRATGRPNTPETTFQIASVSKQFTAAAILLLQEQGLLSVRDRIAAWVPEPAAERQNITIHQLLTHTSGIGHWRDYPELSRVEPTSRENLLPIFQSRPLKFSPGAGWSYSSPAYVLLAYIVEQVSGDPFATFLERSIFQPLGLTSTCAGNRLPDAGRRAVGYAESGPEPSFELDTVGIGAGDIWSTSGDLARWDAALAAPGLLCAASLQAMFAPHAPTPASYTCIPGTSYGYGWFVANIAGQRVRFHPGDNAGYSALNICLPDRDAIIILLCNDELDLANIALRLVHSLADGH
jgi:CubicO group peptidase (beta-lactamase class C family)